MWFFVIISIDSSMKGSLYSCFIWNQKLSWPMIQNIAGFGKYSRLVFFILEFGMRAPNRWMPNRIGYKVRAVGLQCCTCELLARRCIHTRTYTPMQTYTHIYIVSHIHTTHAYLYIQTHKHTYIHANIHKHTYAQTQTYIYTNKHTQLYLNTYSYTHLHIRIYK